MFLAFGSGVYVAKEGIEGEGELFLLHTSNTHKRIYAFFYCIVLLLFSHFPFYFISKKGFFSILFIHETSLMGIFLCFCDNKNVKV